MYIIVILVVLSILFWSLCVYFEKKDSYEYIGRMAISIVLGVISAMLLLVVVVSIPINRMSVESDMASWAAVQSTVDEARAENNSLELAAIQIKVASINSDIASDQYYARNPWTSIFYPKLVLDVKPVH